MVRQSKVTLAVLKLGMIFAVIGCSDRPSHEKFPGGQGRTTDVLQAATQKAVLGGFDPNNNPLAGRPMSGEVLADGPTLAGRVEIDPKAKPKGRILYIFVRNGMGGPPLAVKRVESPVFPVEFSLSAADKMAQHTVFEGDVTLHARLDSDGNAMTTESGDYFAEIPTQVGKNGLVLRLELIP